MEITKIECLINKFLDRNLIDEVTVQELRKQNLEIEQKLDKY